MKQLYYTSCVPGRSRSGEGGFQVRAASPGSTPERQRAILRYVGYRLPPGYDEDTPPREAPLRLALLDTEAGRLLCHSAHVGRDPTTNRTGIYFTHVLIDVPPEIDAGTAASTWKSSFWQLADGEMSVDLPEPGQVPAGGMFNKSVLITFPTTHKDLLRFLITGLLTLPADQRLFVVAQPEEVCRAIWCLTQVLPGPLTEKLTFSTYESDPLSCEARVVGTWWKEADLDLPSACYNGCGAGYNHLTRKCSTLPPLQGFAGRVFELLSQGRSEELVGFYRECQQLGVRDAAGFDLAWRLFRTGSAPSRSDLEQAMSSPGMITRLIGQPGTLAHLLDWTLQDANVRARHFSRLVQAGRRPEGNLFTPMIWNEALRAVKAGEVDRARVALDEMLPIADATCSQWLPDRLVAELDWQPLSWPCRKLLLPRVLSSPKLRSNPEQRDFWLAAGAEQLGEVLALPISEEARLRTVTLCLGRSDSRSLRTILSAVVAQGTLVPELLRQFVADAAHPERLVALFGTLVERADQEQGAESSRPRGGRADPGTRDRSRPGVLDLINQAREWQEQRRLPDTVIDECLTAAFRARRFDPLAFIRSDGLWVLRALPSGRCPVVLVERLFQADPQAVRKDQVVHEFIDAFRGHPSWNQLPPPVRVQLEQQASVATFLTQPKLDDATLDLLAQALGAMPRGKERDRLARQVVQVVVDCLVDIPASEVQKGLESALARLAPVASPGSSWLFGLVRWEAPLNRWDGLFREILDLLLREQKTCRNPSLLLAVLTVGFAQGIETPWLAQRYYTGVEGDGTPYATGEFLRAIQRRCTPVVFSQLATLVKQRWANNPQGLKWWEYSLAPPETKPRSSGRRPRGPLAFLAWLDWTSWLLLVLLVMAVAVFEPSGTVLHGLDRVFKWLLTRNPSP